MRRQFQLAVTLATVLSILITPLASVRPVAAAPLQQAELKVITVPWRPGLPHDTYNGHPTVLKAVIKGGTSPWSYTWEFGDGTSASGSTTNPYVIEAVHIYPDSPSGTPYVATLTVTDSGGESASGTYRAVVRDASLNVRANTAIDDGLWWLHKQQYRYSSGGVDHGYWTGYGGYRISPSANAVSAFEIQGHLPTGDPNTDPYVETVRRGLNYVFSQTRVVNIGPQAAGDPDTNGNGIGVGVSSNREVYEIGMVMIAVAASGGPSLVAATGPANVVGRTYNDILTDMVDLCAWGQNEAGTGRGGWRYNWNYGDSDNSVTQWPVIGLEAAETNWGIAAPAFVKSELDIWLAYSQNANGGFGYNSPTYWVNVGKTGAGIAGLNYIDFASTNSRIVNALNYLDSRWGSSGRDGYWGSYYALYAVMKGMATARPSSITHIGSHDWYAEFANYLVNAQQSGGNWPSGYDGDTVLDTGWALLILSATVFTPPPVANAGPDVVGGVHPEYPAVTLDGSRSYHLNPELRIVAYKWDFGDGTPPYTETEGNAPDGKFDGITTHAYTALGEYTATLTVTDDDPTAPQSASDSALVRITLPDHPPVAVLGGPYVGYVSIPLTLDGSLSYDINQKDGDAITQYGWEIDSVYPYDFDDAFGPTVQWMPPRPGEYNIGLRVTDTPGLFADSPKSHEAWTTIQVGDEPFMSSVAVYPAMQVEMKERTHLAIDVFDALMPPSPRSLTVRLVETPSVDTSPILKRSLNIQAWRSDHWEQMTGILEGTQTTDAGWQANYDFDLRHRWDWIAPLDPAVTLGELLLKFVPSFHELVTITKLGIAGLLLAKNLDNENEITFTYENDSPEVIDPLGKLPTTVTFIVPESKRDWLITSVATSIASTLTTLGGGFTPPVLIIEVSLWAVSKGAYVAAYDPDPNYEETVLPVPIDAPELDSVPPGDLKSAALASLEFLSLQQAATQSFLKAEGAREAGAWDWVAMQLSDSRKYAVQSLDALLELRTDFHKGVLGVTPPTSAQIEAFKADLLANGLPPEEISFLTRLGLTQEEQDDLRDLLVGLPTDFVVEKGFEGVDESLDTAADVIGSLSAELLTEETTIRVEQLGETVSSPTPEELAALDEIYGQVETGLDIGVRSDELQEAIVALRATAEQILDRTNNLDVVLPYYQFAMAAQAQFQQLLLLENTAPSVEAGPDQMVNEGDTVSLAPATFTDPDAEDIHTATISWGDGSSIEPGVINESGGAGTVSSSHVYGDNGTYTVTVRVCDEDGACGEDSFTVTVNNALPAVTAEPASQAVQYSDYIADVTFTATDVAADTLTASTSWRVGDEGFTPGLPNGLALADGGCGVSDGTNTCTWTLSGVADVSAGHYTVRVTVADKDGGQTESDIGLIVLPESASAVFDGDNPVAVRVAEPGGVSGPFSLTVYVREIYPDEPMDQSAPGDINLAQVSMSLTPVGPGGPVEGACAPGAVSGSGYDAVLPVTCTFDGVEVNAYEATVTVGGSYYTGYVEDVLTVYDPSLGFATGGGWFYWPGTEERTNFGFTMKYNKKGQNVKGNLLLIRHLPDGSIYRVKSNALEGLALGEDPSVPMGWASFSGKSTYMEPGWPEPQGNYEFMVYVEDRDEPGAGVDRFWIEVRDKDRQVVPGLSMDREATDNAVELSGGNIAVPHTEGGGKK